MLLLHHQLVSGGVFSGDVSRNRLCELCRLAHWGLPHAGVHDCFAAAAIVPPTARSCSASWARTPPMPGGSIFPAARPIPTISSTARSISTSACARELEGGDRARRGRLAAEPGWTTVVDGALIVQIKVLRAARPRAALRPRILRTSGARSAAGACRHSHRSRAGRFRPGDAGFVTAFLTHHFRRRSWKVLPSAPR